MSQIQEIPFDIVSRRVARYFDPFKYNPHQAWLGISRSGKSYTIRHGILPIAGNSRIVVLDVKPGGERTWNGYGNLVTNLNPGFGIGSDGTPHYRMIVESKQQIKRFIDFIGIEGECVIVFDDSRKITQTAPGYGLKDYVDELITIGAAIGITVIICANSTIWATSGLRTECATQWIGLIPNQEERKTIIRYAGLPEKETLNVLNNLPPRHFLYSDRHDGDLTLAITHL